MAQECPIVPGEGRGDHHCQVRDCPRRRQSLLDLLKVGLGLDDQQIDPGSRQHRDLFEVRVESFGRADPSVGRQPNPEGADAPGHQARPGPPSRGHPRFVQLRHPVTEAAPAKREPTGTERVRQDHVGSCFDEAAMDRLHQPRIFDIEDLETRVQWETQVHQRGAHPAIGQEGASAEAGDQLGTIHWRRIVAGQEANRARLHWPPVAPSGTRTLDVVLWALSTALALAIAVFSLGPQGPPRGFPFQDKLFHGLAYWALTGSLLLVAVWRPGRGRGRFPGSAPLVAAGVLGFGILLEVGQAVGPFGARTGDVVDVLADGVGIAAAVTGWRFVRSGWMGSP